MKRSVKRMLGIVAGGILIGSIVTFILVSKPDRPGLAQIPTAKVEKGTIQVKVNGSGTIACKPTATLRSGALGTVEEVKVKNYSKVEEGVELITFAEGGGRRNIVTSCVWGERRCCRRISGSSSGRFSIVFDPA